MKSAQLIKSSAREPQAISNQQIQVSNFCDTGQHHQAFGKVRKPSAKNQQITLTFGLFCVTIQRRTKQKGKSMKDKFQNAIKSIATKVAPIAVGAMTLNACNRIPKEPEMMHGDKHIVNLEVLDSKKLSSTMLMPMPIMISTGKTITTSIILVPVTSIDDMYVCAEIPNKDPVVLLEKSDMYKPGDIVEAYISSASRYERGKKNGDNVKASHVSKVNGKSTAQFQLDSAQIKLYQKYKPIFQERAVNNNVNDAYKKARKEYMQQRKALKQQYKNR